MCPSINLDVVSAKTAQIFNEEIAIEVIMLLTDLTEDLKLQKLPRKIKDFPKTIHNIDAKPFISDSHL